MWQTVTPSFMSAKCSQLPKNKWFLEQFNKQGQGNKVYVDVWERMATKSFGLCNFWPTKMLGLWGGHINKKWTLDTSLLATMVAHDTPVGYIWFVAMVLLTWLFIDVCVGDLGSSWFLVPFLIVLLLSPTWSHKCFLKCTMFLSMAKVIWL